MLQVNPREITEVDFFAKKSNLTHYRMTYNNSKIFGIDVTELGNFDEIVETINILQEFHIDNLLPFFGYSILQYKNEPLNVLLTYNIAFTTTHGILNNRPKIFDILNYAKTLNRLHSYGYKCYSLTLHNINLEKRALNFIIPFERNIDKTYLSNTLYVAPEKLERGEYTEKSDIYSFGYVIYEFVTGEESFPNRFITYEKHLENIHNSVFPRRYNSVFDKYDGLWELITRCWSIEPSNRPSAQELCNELFLILINQKLANREHTELWCMNTSSDEMPLMTLLRKINFDVEKYNIIREFFGCDIINVDKFSRALLLYPSYSLTECFDKIYELYKNKWYHGDITMEESEKRLLSMGRNSFLIRMSSQPGFLVISRYSRDEDQLLHMRLSLNADGTYTESKVSLENVIQRFANNFDTCDRYDFE